MHNEPRGDLLLDADGRVTSAVPSLLTLSSAGGEQAAAALKSSLMHVH